MYRLSSANHGTVPLEGHEPELARRLSQVFLLQLSLGGGRFDPVHEGQPHAVQERLSQVWMNARGKRLSRMTDLLTTLGLKNSIPFISQTSSPCIDDARVLRADCRSWGWLWWHCWWWWRWQWWWWWWCWGGEGRRRRVRRGSLLNYFGRVCLLNWPTSLLCWQYSWSPNNAFHLFSFAWPEVLCASSRQIKNVLLKKNFSFMHRDALASCFISFHFIALLSMSVAEAD